DEDREPPDPDVEVERLSREVPGVRLEGTGQEIEQPAERVVDAPVVVGLVWRWHDARRVARRRGGQARAALIEIVADRRLVRRTERERAQGEVPRIDIVGRRRPGRRRRRDVLDARVGRSVRVRDGAGAGVRGARGAFLFPDADDDLAREQARRRQRGRREAASRTAQNEPPSERPPSDGPSRSVLAVLDGPPRWESTGQAPTARATNPRGTSTFATLA